MNTLIILLQELDYQKMVGIIEEIALAERELLDYIERVLQQ